MKHKRFPLFIDLTGRRAVVVGGGTIGLRRAGVLHRFGAEVEVVSPALSGPAGGLHWHPRAYAAGDLVGAYLAVAATDDPSVNAAVQQEAKARGILFNRADSPSECDFFFPAICEGEDLLAGLTGSGGNHGKVAEMAKKIRQLLTEA